MSKSSPNSSSSSTTSQHPAAKRTRDMPNLSDCHCCKRRINHTNPNDRLKLLDSVWRIVLICRKCCKRLRSGQTCPYCFRENENSGTFFKCKSCERKIHENCVNNYGNCGDSGSRVCVDCWVPNALKNSIRVCRRSLKGSKNLKYETKNLEKADLGKGTIVKNAASLCNEKDENKEKGENLIRVYRRSFKVKMLKESKNDGLRDSNKVQNIETLAVSTDSYRGLNGGLLLYKRDRKRKIWRVNNESKVIMESGHTETKKLNFNDGEIPLKRDTEFSVVFAGLKCDKSGSHSHMERFVPNEFASVNADRSGSSGNIDRFIQNLLIYKRTRFKCDIRQESAPAGGSGNCSSGDSIVTLEHQDFQPHELPLTDSSTGDGDVILPNGSCNAEIDRYSIKYFKRVRGDKESNVPYFDSLRGESETQASALNGIFNAERDRYSFKYKKRVKGSGPGLSCVFLECENQSHSPCLSKLDGDSIFSNGVQCTEVLDRYYQKYDKRPNGSNSRFNFLSSESENPSNFPSSSNVGTGARANCAGDLFSLNGIENTEVDRYFYKYDIRVKGSKSSSYYETELHFDGFRRSNEGPDRYYHKYDRKMKGSKSNSDSETKLHSAVLQDKNQVSAPGLDVYFSTKCKALSGASLDSSTNHLPN